MIIKVLTVIQQLHLLDDQNNLIYEYPVSTAKAGLGEEIDSYKTPRGWHYIRAKIGAGQPINSVFVSRRSTGEIYTPTLGVAYPNRDWILTRIMWLCGLEPNFNRGGQCDSMRRYIYIHGCPDNFTIGQPMSHGCIRMRNKDIIDLFDRVAVGVRVLITAT